MQEFDLLIIGGGPAGITAGIFAARFGLRAAIIFSKLGGAMSDAYRVENYPPFKAISGKKLAEKFLQHLKTYDVKIVQDEVRKVQRKKAKFILTSASGNKYSSKALILAVGTQRRKLEFENEEKFLGKGISYCATCDGPLFKGKVVGVVGGGGSAFDALFLLSKYAKKVYLIHRRKGFRAEEIEVEQARKKKNVEFLLDCIVEKAEGKERLEGVWLRNVKTGKKFYKELQGLFIEVGEVPSVALAKDLGLKLDANGFIEVKEDMSTSVEGVFAAGDVTTGSAGLRQIATAISEGATAAFSAYKYLRGS